MTEYEQANKEWHDTLRAVQTAEWKAQEAHASLMRYLAGVAQAKADQQAARLRLDDAMKTLAKQKSEAAPASQVSGEGEPEIPEGFIPWSGGEMPVDGNTEVKIIFRDGGTNEDFVEKLACEWKWVHTYDESDIVAYQVVTPAQTESDAPQPPPQEQGEGQAGCIELHERVTGLHSAGVDRVVATLADGTSRIISQNEIDGQTPAIDRAIKSAVELGEMLGLKLHHDSDCPVNNAPAFEPGPRNCGAEPITDRLRTAMDAAPSGDDRIDRPLIVDPIVEKDEPRNEQSEPYGKDHEADVDAEEKANA